MGVARSSVVMGFCNKTAPPEGKMAFSSPLGMNRYFLQENDVLNALKSNLSSSPVATLILQRLMLTVNRLRYRKLRSVSTSADIKVSTMYTFLSSVAPHDNTLQSLQLVVKILKWRKGQGVGEGGGRGVKSHFLAQILPSAPFSAMRVCL